MKEFTEEASPEKAPLHNGDPCQKDEIHLCSRDEEALEIDEDTDTSPRLHYNINENPPIHLCFLFGLQQALLSLSNSLTVSLLIAQTICAENDELMKTKLLCTTMFMSGITTLLQATIGIRLPLYQGPSLEYVIPLVAMTMLSEWKCAEDSPAGNITSYQDALNDTNIYEQESYQKLQVLEGSLMLSGTVHMLVGATGLVGVLVRYIGPITLVPAITLVGMFIFKVAVRFCETHWGIAFLTAGMAVIFSLYLDKYSTILPFWTKSKGFHIVRYPIHKVFAILFAIIIGWSLSAILTVTNVLSPDPNHIEFNARTDSRSFVIVASPWFYFPYPGQFGAPSFSVGVFITFLIATIASIIDSICDYYACANMCNVEKPPAHAINRGIAIEGFATIFSGALGASHGTSTYGGNIGAIGMTKVASRRVFQCVGLIFILFGVLGKLGAFFITIPYPVLGGIQIVSFGIFIGVVLSNLQFIDIKSTRNLAIIGMSLLIGLMMPHWIQKTKDPIQTGSEKWDNIFETILVNPNFVAGVVACFLDNTVPGSLKERGLLDWQKQCADPKKDPVTTGDGLIQEDPIYGIPYVNKFLNKFKISKYIPFLPTYIPSKRVLPKCFLFHKCKRTENVHKPENQSQPL